MIKKSPFLIAILFVLSSCGAMQSVLKSTFPYTTSIVIPKASKVGVNQEITGLATSFDQRFKKDGNNASKVNEVRIVSAKLQSKDPSDFNIGNFTMVKVYMSKEDGSNEVLVASRTDITPGIGTSMVLDTEDAKNLADLVREQKVKIRVVYKLRNHLDVTANLKLVLSLNAPPAG